MDVLEKLKRSAVVCKEVSDCISQYDTFGDSTMVENQYDWIEAILDSALANGQINRATCDLWRYRNKTAYTAKKNKLFYVEQRKEGV